MRAECVDTQSKAMMKLSLDQLCMVLNFAVTRLKHAGVCRNIRLKQKENKNRGFNV